MKIEDETGIYLVKLARHAAEIWIRDNEKPQPIEPIPEQAKLETGAFVTVKTVQGSDHLLRGCIGYIAGIDSLYNEVIELAKASTLNDPRFPPVKEHELTELIFEVTVMTPPQKVEYSSPQELLSQITVPGDGLIVKLGPNQGLLLPQVPVEQGWNAEEFLSYTCRKAYLPLDEWKNNKLSVEKFQGIVFSEQEPNGSVVRQELKDSC